MVASKNKISSVLIEVLKGQMGSIAESIEREGEHYLGGNSLLTNDEISDFCIEFLQLLINLLNSKDPYDDASPQFHALEMFFNNLSKQILVRGGRVEDLVRYIQFMQGTLIESLGAAKNIGPEDMRGILLYLSGIFNELILAVFQAYLDEKERTIHAQEAELRETATPITEIWDGVLTLPIIGTLDSSRTMVVMEALLNRIAAEHAETVVMDLTGVKSIDSQVSHHLIQMVRAVQLMGANAIVTGIRPEIARALTSLNIDLGNVTTRATLSDGLKEAFQRMNLQVVART